LAYALDAPILLTSTSSLDTATAEEIQRLEASQVVILGGRQAISPEVEEELADMGLTVDRITGDNRYETAVLIAQQVAPEGAEIAALVNGQDFPDALSVAAYAAQAGMPILLTETDTLPAETAQALEDLAVEETIVVGGRAVIGDEQLTELPAPVRLKGDDRYATSVAVAQHFEPESARMYAATGLDFADVLSGAVLAAKNGAGVLLVSNTVSQEVGQYLTDKGVVRVTIFGGRSVVSEEVVAQLQHLLK